ncbi:DUF1289 domain-containing protein [Vibrio scophthalmi]|uniref:DUF1289 domain-containing protein n=1 Tax=Vibrio scophthalmi TaxID=45658 RepID=UPI002FF0BF49
MKTPCIAACKNNSGICSGCHRTMDEIVQWSQHSDEQRDHIMDSLSGQQSTHTCPQCASPTQCDISLGKSTCWCFSLEERDKSTLNDDTSRDLCLCRRCLSALPLA